MKNILILLILFSVGVMGQLRVTSPLDVTNPIKVNTAPVKTYDANTRTWYINPT